MKTRVFYVFVYQKKTKYRRGLSIKDVHTRRSCPVRTRGKGGGSSYADVRTF